MTKVYLILQFDCNEKGMMIKGSKQVFEVFTNKRLANKAVDYLNEEWREGFQTGNFKKVKWYAVQVHSISHEDYSKLSY